MLYKLPVHIPPKENSRSSMSISLYMCALVLVLLWRPNHDFGFILTPTYLIFPLILPLLLFSRRIVLHRFDVALLLFFFFSLLTSSYAPVPGTSIKFFLGVTVFLGMYLFFKLSLHNVELDTALSVFGKVGKFYFSCALLFYLMGFLSYESWQEHQLYYGIMVERAIPRLVAFGRDPNMGAMTLIPFIFYFMLSRKSHVWLFLGLFLLLATMSRGAIIALIVGLVCVAILTPTKISLGAIGVTLLLAAFGSAAIVFFDVLPVSYLEQRMAGFASGSGRVEIWLNALELFSLRPIVGWGGFSFRDINQFYFDDSRFAHNTYIEVMVESGYVGLLMFLFSLFLMVRRSIEMSVDSRLLFVLPAIFSFLVSMCFLSIYINQIFVFYLSLLIFPWAKEA